MLNFTPSQLGQTMSKSILLSFTCFALLFSSTDCLAQLNIEQNITHVSCNGYGDGSATLNVSGGMGPYEVAWLSMDGATGMTQSGLTSGIHSVQVTDSGTGETTQVDFTINEPEVLNTYFTSSTFVNCSGDCIGSTSLAINGGTPPYDFEWPNGAVVSADGLSASGLCAGTDVIEVTDANGCGSFAVLLIEAPENVVFVSTIPTDATCGGSDGVATVEGFNGSPPYTYLWDNGHTGAVLTDLAPGTYSVAVTDAINCTTEASVTVGTISQMTATITTNNVTCFGSQDGNAFIDMDGGTPPYSFDYGTLDPDAIGPGVYPVTITDANDCIHTETFQVLEPSELSLSVESTDETCAGCADGTVSITTIGGTGNYSYDYLNVTTGTPADINSLSAGSYEVMVTDGNGCTVSTVFEIDGPAIAADLESIPASSTLGMTLFPNPVKDFATLILPEAFEAQLAQIRLIDISGKVQWSHQNHSANYTFYKGNCSPGVYILEAISGKERARIKLILE